MMTLPADSHDQTGRSHRLWWRPGTHGRGVLFESGSVHTWPENEGSHRARAELVASRPLMFFYIRTDGRVRIPERHAHRAAHISAALVGADRRLAPFTPAREPTRRDPHPGEPALGATSPDANREHEHRRAVDHAWDVHAAARLARIRRRY